MKLFTIYSKDGKVVLATFNEDRAWGQVNLEVGEYVEVSTDDD